MNDHLYIWTPCVRPLLLGALAHSVAQAAAGGVLDDVSLIADIVGPSSYEHRCDRVLERIKALAVSPTAWFWFTSDDTLVTAACIRAWRQTVALHPEISCIMLRQQRVERSAEPDFLPAATSALAPAKCDSHQFVFRAAWYMRWGYRWNEFHEFEGATFAKLHANDPDSWSFRDDVVCLHDAQVGAKLSMI